MKLAFIKNNKVIHCYHIMDIYAISKANFKKDWQRILEVSSEVEPGWNYNPETMTVTRP